MSGSDDAPTVLYKYRALGEYTDAIFGDRQVFLSTASGLNDPFECSIEELSKSWVNDRVFEAQSAQYQGFVMLLAQAAKRGGTVGALKPNEVRAALKAFKGLRHKAAYAVYRAWSGEAFGYPPSDPRAPFRHMDRNLGRVGIFSLSEDPENPLMWSHYGGEGRGVALGFARSEGSKLAGEACVKVTYSDHVPSFSGGLIVTSEYRKAPVGVRVSQVVGLSDPTFRLAASTKSVHWSYEREWRYLEPTSGLYPLPGPLVELVFGVRCATADRTHILEMVESFADAIRVFEMQRVPGAPAGRRVPVDL